MRTTLESARSDTPLSLNLSVRLCSHKYYVDGMQRPKLRGWSQTLFFIFGYPLLFWHMLCDPRYEDQFLAPQW